MGTRPKGVGVYRTSKVSRVSYSVGRPTRTWTCPLTHQTTLTSTSLGPSAPQVKAPTHLSHLRIVSDFFKGFFVGYKDKKEQHAGGFYD